MDPDDLTKQTLVRRRMETQHDQLLAQLKGERQLLESLLKVVVNDGTAMNTVVRRSILFTIGCIQMYDQRVMCTELEAQHQEPRRSVGIERLKRALDLVPLPYLEEGNRLHLPWADIKFDDEGNILGYTDKDGTFVDRDLYE